jgi:3-oxoacyl-(acyl-carrier-protein) synthase
VKGVHVVGTGLITAIGNSVHESFQSLKSETSGIGSLSLFDTFHQHLPVGEVKISNQALAEKLDLPLTLPRAALLGVHAAREAWHSAGIQHSDKWNTGLTSATTVGGMDKIEKFIPSFRNKPSNGKLRDVIHHGCGNSTELIADALGINGFVSTVNTACSSSVNSIILAARLISEGILDVAVAGGTDALTKFTLNGFNSLMILDKQLCRPFDASRAGLNLGEGAGFVVLVSDRVLREEKMNSICRIAGYGNANDAYHQTASSPEGRGSFGAMKAALKMSGLLPADIDYINLHGTGTLNNDLSEGTAVKRLFGEHLPKISSTKGFTGHTLGASGGIEAVFSAMAISEQCVFSNLRFETPIPELGITPQTRFEQGIKVSHVMSNSFGFGGNCSSILFSKTN